MKIGSVIFKDIRKSREYICEKKGHRQFHLSAVIVAPSLKEANKAFWEVETLKNHQARKTVNEVDKKILFGWINPKDEIPEPELFWIW